MPRKSMVQGYKTSNSTGTSRRTTGNGYTILKGSVLFSYPGKKGEYGTLSCKNDDRHPYDKRNKDTATKLDLPELEKSDRETGGIMLNVTEVNRFHYMRNFHDMRCKYERVPSIIHQQQNREPQEDDFFIVMSKSNLFSYLNNGRYDINNSIAECFIRPLADERKNSLFFFKQTHGKCIGSLSYTALNMPNERTVCSGISQEILPRNCQREKGL